MTSRHCIPFLLFLYSCLPIIAFSADTNIVISEIQSTGIKADDEFVHLFNPADSIIDVTGFKLSKKSISGGACKESALVSEKGFTGIIGPKGTFTISHPLYREKYNADLTYSSDSYYITDNTVVLLYDKNKRLIDRKAIGNACDEIIVPPSTPTTYDIRINELLPNPTGADSQKEWVELFNFGTTPINLVGWTFTRKSGSPTPIPEHLIPEGGFLVVPLSSLTNTSDTLSILDSSKNIIHKVSYEKAVEGASLNHTPTGYRWSRIITPGTENILNSIPETKKKEIPDTAYRNVLTTFSASGKDDDGDTVKYVWDFGDGHKSYLRKTTHRYEEEGKYEGTLAVSDGTESVVTAFTIDVEKYEAPKIRMTTLLPNPTGKDTDTEYITIENRSKKSVDLLGWSIATGWKKLVNHPIRESFVIAKKSKRNITHTFSAFTLPNEKGRIELRSPDGKTVQKLKYNLKGISVKENTLLIKEKGKKWEWREESSIEDDQQKITDEPKIQQGTSVSPLHEQADIQDEQLRRDTEIIVRKKKDGEVLFSTEKNGKEEMRRLISFGTDIETPVAVLTLAPRVAGAYDEIPTEQKNIGEDFSMNALINHWLERE